MSERPPSPASPSSTGAASFAERLSVPWWWWPPVLLVAAILAAQFHLGYPGVRSWLPYVILLLLTCVLLVRLGNQRVEVSATDPEGPAIRARGARLPVRFAGRTDVVRGSAKQDALGPQLDPTAFVVHRPWVPAAVRIEVLDPDDRTPYWLVSTRRPERLVEVIDAHRPTGEGPGHVGPGA